MKGVFFDREILLEQLSSDVKILSSIADLIPITIYSRIEAVQSTNNSTDHLRFLFYQLFIHQYCLNSSSSSNKTDLLELIRTYYQTNRSESKQIDRFEDEYHSSQDSLRWFLQECFLQRILKKSLLTLDIPVLFSTRFFVNDMHKAMIEKSSSWNSKSNFSSRRFNSEQIFYRGQALSKETLLKIKANTGEILSMNDFVFASKNRHDSLGYLRQNVPATTDVYRVLFEMKIPSEYSLQKQRPFIELNPSRNDDDDNNLFSILFFIGSIFRIHAAEFDINNECWVIQLTLYDEDLNEDFAPLFTFLRDIKRSQTECIVTLATLLRQISPNAAEEFYRYLLKENSQSLSKFECYRGLGLCSYSQDDYDQALTFFKEALNLKPNDKLIKSSLHNNIGLVYAQQNETERALTHFNQALENTSNPLHIACVHHNLALIYSKKGLYEDELDHYEEALRIRTSQYPAHHLQMASLHNNIGIAYSDMREYDQALSNLKKALEIRLKLLPDTHIDVARSYANIGTVYAKTQEFRMAIEFFNKAHLLFEKQESQTAKSDIEQLDRNMKFVNDKLRYKFNAGLLFFLSTHPFLFRFRRKTY